MIKYPKYKDSGIAWLREVPEHWRIESFKNILSERNEKNNPIKSQEILSLSIDKGVTLYAEKTTNLDRFKDDVSKYKLAHKGDLVLNSMNMIVGAVGVSDYFGCVSPVYYTFYGNNNEAYTTRFYEYLFKCKTFQGVLYTLGRGLIAIDRGEGKFNTLRLKVSRDDLRSMRLPFPKISEQIALVNFLDYKTEKIDRFISKKKELIKLLSEQKNATINQVVTKGINPNTNLNPSGIEWLGDIPEHWSIQKVKESFQFSVGFTPDTSIPSYYYPEDYIWVNISDLKSKYISSSAQGISKNYVDKSTKEIIPKGSLLYSFKLSVGKVSITTKELYTNEAILAIYPDSKIDVNYFYYSLPQQVIYNANENIYGAKILNQKLIKNAYILIPPLSEQKEIVNYLDSELSKIDQVIETIKKEISLVKEYKTALIAEAVTGKMDVRGFKIPTKEEPLEMVAEEASNYNKAD